MGEADLESAMSPMSSVPFSPSMPDGTHLAVERNIVADMARRSLPLVLAIVAGSGALWGIHGAFSSAYAIALVLANLTLSAALLSWGARVAPTVLMAVVLFGYIGRLALLTVAVLLVHNQFWVEIVPLGLSIIITHLGLLFWEMRYISATFAFPDLKPKKGR